MFSLAEACANVNTPRRVYGKYSEDISQNGGVLKMKLFSRDKKIETESKPTPVVSRGAEFYVRDGDYLHHVYGGKYERLEFDGHGWSVACSYDLVKVSA
jgi:hypothetical protein